MAAADRPDSPARSDPAPAGAPPRHPDAAAPPADRDVQAEDVQAEVDALLALVQRRYGTRLTAEELESVRKGIQGVVEGARALRAVRLGNADEPFQPFAPFRADA